MICNWSRLSKVPVVKEDRTHLPFQVISHLCVSVKRTPWALHSTFTSLRMNSSPTQFSPNRLHSICPLIPSLAPILQYDMKCLPDQDDPFSFEGPEIFKCVGSAIDWLPGKNLTVKQVPEHQVPFDFRYMMNYSKRSESLSPTSIVRFARDQSKDLPELLRKVTTKW